MNQNRFTVVVPNINTVNPSGRGGAVLCRELEHRGRRNERSTMCDSRLDDQIGFDVPNELLDTNIVGRNWMIGRPIQYKF